MPNLDPAVVILIPPAILGLVEFLKTFGLAGRALTAVSFLIGALVGVGVFFLPIGTFTQILHIALFGLAASGFYDIAKLIGTGFNKPAAK